ncbi:cell adhesion molecule 2-like isoform X1 [Solea senegalensis]|nr:uncharacterized protein si:rp71-81e14.2 [Solea senegalensis]KAG7487109.1 cell adhesion molecule 2-like isoform X1 [Solea senegalensis]
MSLWKDNRRKIILSHKLSSKPHHNLQEAHVCCVYLCDTHRDSIHHSGMMSLRWFVLLLFVFTNADNIMLWRESGGNVTLECSYTECPRSIDGCVGMYLYHDSRQQQQEEVLYYHSSPAPERITPRMRYWHRVEKKGQLKNHTVTIRDLNMGDSGIYKCVYIKNIKIQVTCSVYTLFIAGVAQCPTSSTSSLTKLDMVYKRPDPLLVVLATCAVTLFTTLFFMLLILRVKRWTQKTRRRAPPIENVYEIMNKSPVAAPE